MQNIKYAVLDTFTMWKRCMSLSMRNIDTIITSVVLPVLMMLLFVYVFGGAMYVGDVDYVNYIVPGILILTIGQCSGNTSISVNQDMTKGIIDRFKSMPIAKSSVLTGRVFTSITHTFVATFFVILTALIIGFRPEASLGGWITAIFIMLLYMGAIAWISVIFGLLANSSEGAGAFMIVVMLFPYLSSGFAPTETMPPALRAFAENQPLTPIIESIRYALMYTGDNPYLFTAIAWCIVLLVVGYIISMRLYNSSKK